MLEFRVMGEEILSVFSSWRLFRNAENRVAWWRIFYFFLLELSSVLFCSFCFPVPDGDKIKGDKKTRDTCPFKGWLGYPPPPPTPRVLRSTHIFWNWIKEGVEGGGEGGPARPFIMKANSVYYKEGCQMTHFFGYGFREYILFWSFIVLLYLPVPVVKREREDYGSCSSQL